MEDDLRDDLKFVVEESVEYFDGLQETLSNVSGGELKIYNREYLYYVRKNLNEIISLVEKFVKSSDTEKYRTLGLHTLTNDEDTKNMFQAKNAQCQIMLDLTNVLDNLISKSLNELQEKEQKEKNKII